MVSFITGFVALSAARALAASPFSVDSHDDTVATAKTVARDLMGFYQGNNTGQTPGILPGPPPVGPYYWWNGAIFWSSFIDYFHITGDAQYNDVVTQGLLWQRGSGDNYLPLNWTMSMGNDDQCIWAMAALDASEAGLPEPKGAPLWAALASNAFDTIIARYKMENACGGGLRWQILPANRGYNYKETIANACYFNLAARLFQSTGNATYSDAAQKVFEWMVKIGYIDAKTSAIYNGGHTEENCTDINKALFSYPAAHIVQGASIMYNKTSGDTQTTWKTSLDKLLDATLKTFFPKGIAVEVACELESRTTCTTDMLNFKGILHRFLAGTARSAPYTAAKITPVLNSSAKAAVAQCTGGDNGRLCGFRWADSNQKGSSYGLTEQMSVFGAVESLLLVTANYGTGGAGGGGGGGSGSGSGSSGGSDKPSSAGHMEAMGWQVAVAVLAVGFMLQQPFNC